MRYRIIVTLPSDRHLKAVLGAIMALTRTTDITGARIHVQRLDGRVNGHEA